MFTKLILLSLCLNASNIYNDIYFANDDITPVLKVSKLDGSDANGLFTQELIQGTSTVVTTFNESGDFLIDGSEATQINEKIYVGANFEGTIKINNVNIFYSGSNQSVGSPIYVDPSANLTLLLSGENVISAPQYFPAIGNYGSNASTGELIIDSDDGGSLTASTSGSGAATIGGRGLPGDEIYVSDITIKNGNFNLKTYGTGGSCIGTGERGIINKINIEGGNIDAYCYGSSSFGSGAAIGSGSDGKVSTINISGGDIIAYTASSSCLSSSAPAIGSGSYGKVDNILISGGKIFATSTINSAIGSGRCYSNSNNIESIEISGGIVKTINYNEGSQSSIGIESNSYNTLNKMLITGGSISTDYFTTSPIDDKNEDLYKVNIPWDESIIDSIFVDSIDMNITDLTGGEKNINLYLPGKNADITINSNNNQYKYEAIYNASDKNFTVNDLNTSEIPSTSLNCVPSITTIDKQVAQFSYFDDEIAKQGITAYDEEDGNITDRIIVEDNPVDTDIVGDYYVTFSVMDDDGAKKYAKSKVSVYYQEVAEPPVIYANDMTFEYMEVFDENKVLANAKAYDYKNNDISSLLKIKQHNVNTSIPGEYWIIYEVSSDGFTTTLKINATVLKQEVSNNFPIIECQNFAIKQNQYLSDKEIISFAKVNAYDEEDGNITDRVIISNNDINYEKVGVYNVEFKVTDNDNNTTFKSINVSVEKEDIEKPSDDDDDNNNQPNANNDNTWWWIIISCLIGGIIAAALVILPILIRKKGKK